MIGTFVNVAAILVGSTVGSLLKKGIKEKYSDALFTAMGLAALFLGVNSVVQNMPKSQYPVLFIASLAIGSLIGTVLNIDGGFKKLVAKLDRTGKKDGTSAVADGSVALQSEKKNRLSQGLGTAVLLFCIGTLSILGPINSAIKGDHTYLFTNATLDLVTSTVLASTYGFGIALAALVLLCWQGLIYLLATLFGGFLTPDMMTEISVVGGILIAGSGISILGIKEIKTMNMLPALIIPVAFLAVLGLF